MKLTAFIPLAKMIRGFIGDSALTAGGWLIATNLFIFALDITFALSLQRFFTVSGLIVSPQSPPDGMPFATPLAEGATLFALGAARAVCVWLAGILAGKCQVTVETEWRKIITRWALGTGNVALGRVMTLYNDVVVGSAAAVSGLAFLAGRAVLLLGIIVVLVWNSPTMAIVVLVALALVTPIHAVIDDRIKRNSSLLQTSLAVAVDRTSAAVKNALFLRIHGIIGEEVRRIGVSIAEYAAGSRRFYSLSALRAALPQMMGLFVLIAIAAEGGTWLGDDKSRVVAYLFLVLRLFQNLSDFARVTGNLRLNWPRLSVMWAWWRDDFQTARRSIDQEIADGEGEGRLEKPFGWRSNEVSFAWNSKEPTAIDRLRIDISAGQMLVVTGPSGAGKTSLMFLLAGLIEPTQGRIELTGSELGVTTPREARSRLLRSIAYVGPDPFVVPGTIRDQLTFGLSFLPSNEALQTALVLAQCDFVGKLVLGLDHRVSEQGSGLSAGQKQRLALARALLRQPVVLFLDEATSNLDSDTERAIIEAISSLRGRMTIIAITHRNAMLAIADQVLDLGKLKEPVSSDCSSEEKSVQISVL